MRIHQSPNTCPQLCARFRHAVACVDHLPYDLHLNEHGVKLVDPHKKLSPLFISFISPQSEQFARSISKNQPLLRALGKAHPARASILDATAGWGTDSFIILQGGYRVISVEAHPLVAAILEYSTNLYQIKHPLTQWRVIHAYSDKWLQQARPMLSAIYLDPFFTSKRSALPQNRMQWLQHLSPQPYQNTLLKQALTHSCRVVVKRERHAHFLEHVRPHHQIWQKSSRFDCYIP